MPYSGPDDSSLPEHVAAMPKKKRKQWIAVMESSMAEGHDEGEAMKMANGVVSSSKGYVDDWDLAMRQVSLEHAHYDAMGGVSDGNMACANCNWFVTPDSCCMCSGDVAATGKCDMHMVKPDMTMEPIPVTIVKEASKTSETTEATKTDGLVHKAITSVRSLFRQAPATPTPPVRAPLEGPAVRAFKQADGRTRVFLTFTNCYEDKHREIFSTVAHKEFLAWADGGKLYPELHLWHAGAKSRWGQVDWLDFVDGFMVASALVDSDKEYVAEALVGMDVAVSHGYIGLLQKDGVYTRYRTFEVSPLPRGAEANIGTNYLSVKEGDMAFSEAKREWLKTVGKMDETAIKAAESDVEGLAQKMKDLGIQYKEEAEATDQLLGQVVALTKAVGDLVGVVAGQKAEIAVLKTDMDKKVADVFTAEIAKVKAEGFSPTQSPGNVVAGERAAKDKEWFDQIVLGGIKNAAQ